MMESTVAAARAATFSRIVASVEMPILRVPRPLRPERVGLPLPGSRIFFEGSGRFR